MSAIKISVTCCETPIAMLTHGHMISDDCLPVTLFLSVLLRDIWRHVRKRGHAR